MAMVSRRKKQTMVELVVEGTNTRDSFEFAHAERLLRMGTAANGGWVLPENSRFEYDDEEDGLRLRANKENITESL